MRTNTLHAHSANVIEFPSPKGLRSVDRIDRVGYSPQLSDLSTDRTEETNVSALRRRKETTTEPLPAGAPSDAVKRDFGRRLYRLMISKGWNQSDLARAAERYVADGKFGRDNVSGYIRGLRIPGATYLAALAKALDVSTDELLSGASIPPSDKSIPEFDMKAIGDGKVWVRVNQALSWDAAKKIMEIVEEG